VDGERFARLRAGWLWSEWLAHDLIRARRFLDVFDVCLDLELVPAALRPDDERPKRNRVLVERAHPERIREVTEDDERCGLGRDLGEHVGSGGDQPVAVAPGELPQAGPPRPRPPPRHRT